MVDLQQRGFHLMGDIVGVHEPHVKHAAKIIKQALRNEGLEPDTLDPLTIRAMAEGIAGYFHRPIKEHEFIELVRNHLQFNHAWALLLMCG